MEERRHQRDSIQEKYVCRKKWLIKRKVRERFSEMGLKQGKLQRSYQGINRSQGKSAKYVGGKKHGNRLSSGCRLKKGTKRIY